MKRVLIAEDELLVARTYAIHLQKAGYEVCPTVSDGETAVEKCKALNPDVVVMDINLKNGTNGFYAALKIREFSSVPIVFTTGSAITEAESQSARIPNSAVLTKPVEPIQVEKMIARLLQTV